MAILEVKHDDDSVTTYSFNTYTISPSEKGLLLKISTLEEPLKYIINSDRRAADIQEIETFISDYFSDVLTNNTTAYIDEYLDRSYLFIGDDKNCRQFTAHKEQSGSD